MYKELKRFIESGKEQHFCDALMRVVIVEIKIGSGQIYDLMLLPRETGGCWSEGEYYEGYGIIKDILSPKILSQIKKLIIEGSKIAFENAGAVKNWIHGTTGISQCSL